MNKERSQKILLGLLVAVLLFIVARQYLPSVQLPTESRLQGKLLELKSVRGDLAVARKTLELRREEAKAIQGLTDSFWIAGEGAKLDQEVNSEFNRIMRLAQIAGVAGTQKVDLGREKPGSFMQEVTVSMDFRNISMQDLSRLFVQLRNDRQKGRFRWEYCKITPDNPRTPKAVNVSLRLKVLALNEDALGFLGYRNAKDASPAPSAAAPPKGAASGLSRKK